jgi:hypothetical protein
MKREPTEWGNSFASYLSNRGLISGIHKELKKLNSKKNITQLVNRQQN